MLANLVGSDIGFDDAVTFMGPLCREIAFLGSAAEPLGAVFDALYRRRGGSAPVAMVIRVQLGELQRFNGDPMIGVSSSSVVDGLASDDPELRAWAMVVSEAFMDESDVVERVRGGLMANDARIRSLAARLVALSGDLSSAPAIVRLLDEAPDDRTYVAWAAERLGEGADPSVRRELVSALRRRAARGDPTGLRAGIHADNLDSINSMTGF